MVGRHVVRRVVRVEVGDARGRHHDGAGLVGREVGRRVERVRARPAGDGRCMRAARRAVDRVPRTADRDVLAEGDRDVRVVRRTYRAPFAGVFEATDGAASPPVGPNFWGLLAFGPTKSATLSSVSWVPLMRS